VLPDIVGADRVMLNLSHDDVLSRVSGGWFKVSRRSATS
jgi:hypothetical protein